MKLFEYDEQIKDYRVLVRASDIKKGVIDGYHIAPGAITEDKIAPGAIHDISIIIDHAHEATDEARQAATNAQEIAEHPTYIGDDYFVYQWDAGAHEYVRTNIYVKGDLSETDIMTTGEAVDLFENIFDT